VYRRGVSVEGGERDMKHAFGNENGYRMFIQSLQRKRSIGRPRHRWKGILN
jgi:hypothetical protein